jgi:hypothetical protein
MREMWNCLTYGFGKSDDLLLRMYLLQGLHIFTRCANAERIFEAHDVSSNASGRGSSGRLTN